MNVSDLDGCYDLSNPATVTRNAGDDCEGGDGGDGGDACDGISVWSDDAIYTGGQQAQFDGTLYEAKWWTRGANPAEQSGDFDVWINLGSCNDGGDGGDDVCSVDGGVLSLVGMDGTSFTICAGDGVADPFTVKVADASGENFSYVVTGSDGTILMLTNDNSFDFEGAGAGECQVWGISFETGLSGAEVGMNVSDLDGCYDLSNPVTVTRNAGDDCEGADECSVDGGVLSLVGMDGTSFTICAGDGVADPFTVKVAGAYGENFSYVVTGSDGTILMLTNDSNFDFEGAGAGECQVWGISFDTGLSGAEVGMNVSDLDGCYDLSNPVTVTRNAGDDCEGADECNADGGVLSLVGMDGTSFTICAGDGVADPFTVKVAGAYGENFSYVVTGSDGTILMLTNDSNFDFEGAGAGECQVWGISFDSDLSGAEVGMNVSDLDGCYDLSNPATVTRNAGDDCEGSDGGDECPDVQTWASTAVYTGGAEVQLDGIRYEAKWWTQGNNPAQNSGPDAVWRILGSCSSDDGGGNDGGNGGGGDGGDCGGDFKVVGYFPSWQGAVSSIQFDKLSHINYSFIIPNGDGTLRPLDNVGKLQQLVSTASGTNTKVLIAIGGWLDGDDSVFSTMAANDAARAAFINNVMSFVDQYGLDGVDMDWEYPREGNEPQLFDVLMEELGARLHAEGKLLTAAVVSYGWNGDGVLSTVFDDVDFLNLMAYDGSDHGLMSQAEQSLDYWLGRGLPKEKAILGVPFYSRSPAVTYANLLARGASPQSDVFNGMRYNGIPTIKAKTSLAQQRGGGIMIWEISQDSNDPNTSLLTAINQVSGTPCAGTARAANRMDDLMMTRYQSTSTMAPGVSVYPNPTQGGLLNVSITTQSVDVTGGLVIQIFDANGKLTLESRTDLQGTQRETRQLDVSRLATGMYYYQVATPTATHSGKFVRQ